MQTESEAMKVWDCLGDLDNIVLGSYLYAKHRGMQEMC